MLTLDNFETQLPAVIVQRGMDYYEDGNVFDLEETADNTWTATVEGTDTYLVEITMGKCNTITDYFCDCPYDGDTCKHVAAVLFTLRDEIREHKKEPKAKKKKEVFENLLQDTSLKEVQDFIRMYAAKHKDFKTAFELFFADKDARVDVEQKYTELVNKLIKKHSDHGYIDYRATSALSREIDKLLEDGKEYIQKQNFRDAFALAKAVLKPTIEAITDADDSNGSMSGSISGAITLLEHIADTDVAAVTIKEQVFQFLQTELNNKLYFDYGDFGYELFEVFKALAIQLNETDAFLHFLDTQVAGLKGDYENYRKEHFRTAKIEFLQAIGKNKEAEEVIQQSMDIVEVRLAAVNKAIEKKDYTTAKNLIADGIKIAEQKKHPGTVDAWEKVLLQIAVSEKDTDTIRHYTRHFALARGFSPEYYKMWKATYPPAEWKEVIEAHIAETLQKVNKQKGNQIWSHGYLSELYNLAPIYIQERYWDRLLALVQKENSLNNTFQFHEYLAKEYPKELLDVYLPALETYAMKTDNRSQYADLVQKMKKIMKDIPGGKELILALAQKLKAHFSIKPRRPAMIEELNKILE